MADQTEMKFGAEVCRVLGFEPNNVLGLTIHVESHRAVVTVECLAALPTLPGLQRLIGEYELAPKGWR